MAHLPIVLMDYTHPIISRFWQKFMYDRGWVPKDEYAKKLINQGMILGEQELSEDRIGVKPLRSNEEQESVALDTLDFDQWLQWMLLPKMNDLLLRQLPLPDNCAIHPMAEEVYDQEDAGAVRLISIIAEIDTLLTEGQGGLN